MYAPGLTYRLYGAARLVHGGPVIRGAGGEVEVAGAEAREGVRAGARGG